MKTSYELSLTESEMRFLMNVISEFIVQSLVKIEFDSLLTPLKKQKLESLLDDAKSISEKLDEATR